MIRRRAAEPPEEPATPANNSRVEILRGTHQVIIDAPDSLNAVTAAALKLWQDTTEPGGVGGPIGFSTSGHQVSEPYEHPLMGPDVSLPHQLTQQENPDDRTR